MTYLSPIRVVPGLKNAGKATPVSSGACAGGTAGKCAGLDPCRERREFPERWGAWCKANFRTSAQLAASFGIDDKTARDWMGGKRQPGGWAVDLAKDGKIDNVVPFPSQPAPARERQKARRGVAA